MWQFCVIRVCVCLIFRVRLWWEVCVLYIYECLYIYKLTYTWEIEREIEVEIEEIFDQWTIFFTFLPLIFSLSFTLYLPHLSSPLSIADTYVDVFILRMTWHTWLGILLNSQVSVFKQFSLVMMMIVVTLNNRNTKCVIMVRIAMYVIIMVSSFVVIHKVCNTFQILSPFYLHKLLLLYFVNTNNII